MLAEKEAVCFGYIFGNLKFFPVSLVCDIFRYNCIEFVMQMVFLKGTEPPDE